MFVLLIYLPWEKKAQEFRQKLKIESVLPSLGLGYIAAMLEQNGINVELLDATVQGVYLEKLANYLEGLEKKPEYIGISTTTTQIDVALEASKICKDVLPEAKIVLGGVHPTVMPDETISDENVDYIIRGEGEYSFLKLVQGENIGDIPGLSYKKDSVVIHNPPGGRIRNLDDLPFPAYHLMPMEKYHPPLGVYRRLPAVNVITARGCPNLCTYCATQTIWGNRMLSRSIENIIAELKYLTKYFGIKEIYIADDTFTFSRRRIIKLCEGILANNIDLTWSCNSRLEKMDEEVLSLMKRAGCHQICYGVESADEQILKNINKNINLDKAREILKLTQKVGITCRASFMVGNPGETEETLRKSLDFAREVNPDFVVFNITTPFPGTPMYSWAKEKGYLMDEDWSTYHGSRVHLRLPTISPERVEEFQRYAMKSFYFRPRYIISRLLRTRTRYDIQLTLQSFKKLLRY